MITVNEEKRLPKVLEAVKDIVDEIVIVDSGSTDGTQAVAASYGAKFLFHQWESVGHQVRWAEEQCSHEWVLRLDADEVMTDALVEEIRQIRQNGTKDGYYMRSGEMFPGMKEPNPWVKHYNLIRLYNRNAFSMSGRMGHDDVEPQRGDVQTGQLKYFVKHYSYLTLHRLIEKNNRSTDRQQERIQVEGKTYSPWRMVGAMSFNFIKYYLIGRFFLLGWWGFMHSINLSYTRFLKFAKYYEHTQLEKHTYMD